jgi:peptide/nickel transport system permease protein
MSIPAETQAAPESTQERLARATASVQAGRIAEAEGLLVQIVDAEPENAGAWSWLAVCMRDPAQKTFCLEKALLFNPNNLKLRRDLVFLSEQTLESREPEILVAYRAARVAQEHGQTEKKGPAAVGPSEQSGKEKKARLRIDQPRAGEKVAHVGTRQAAGSMRFFQRPQNIFALLLAFLFLVVALGADWLAPQKDIFWPTKFRIASDRSNIRPHPPSAESPLGTVLVGGGLRKQMDVYTSLVRGTRQALEFGLEAALATACIGILLGSISGAKQGWIGGTIQRITDAMLAVPVLVGVFIFQQVALILGNRSMGFANYYWGPPQLNAWMGFVLNFLDSVNPVLLAMILFSWMPYARMMNTMVLRTRQAAYIEAARAQGAGGLRVYFHHLLPNSISPAIVLLARDIGGFVVLQATLTFIGIGGNSIWGMLLVYGRNYMVGTPQELLAYWWVFVPATFTIILFGLCWNLLGDGLNDWINPHLKHLK